MATHELVMTGFGGYWRLAWLPGPGSLGDQDAWLMDGLALVRTVSQSVLLEGRRDEQRTQDLSDWRERIRRERG